ncbi:MAG: cupin domain-containing protein [Gemmatimonadetes bacterium]|nr:cupin domain-containing protein [Gemmatimonadota bacterium]
MHYFGTFEDRALAPHPTYDGHSEGYTHAALVDHATGSLHTGLSIDELAPGGTIAPHVHAYEESFYLLSGQAVLGIGEQTYLLGPGDLGALKVGTRHAWRNTGSTPVRWLQMAAPQPKPLGQERDTFFQKGGLSPRAASPLGPDRPDGHLLGHFDVGQIPKGEEGRISSGGLKGVFLKWLIDEAFGAIHHRLLLIEYLPGVSLGAHDHAYEEAYFILSGEVEATLDDQRYKAKPGDVLWTGVGCVHAFANTGSQPVRWLETFSPQPPKENVFRFMADWEQRGRELEG